MPVRVDEIVKNAGVLNGISVIKKSYGEIDGLPKPEPNTFLVVSAIVLQAGKGVRNDLVSPDTGPESVVRDKQGRILGVRRFQK